MSHLQVAVEVHSHTNANGWAEGSSSSFSGDTGFSWNHFFSLDGLQKTKMRILLAACFCSGSSAVL